MLWWLSSLRRDAFGPLHLRTMKNKKKKVKFLWRLICDIVSMEPVLAQCGVVWRTRMNWTYCTLTHTGKLPHKWVRFWKTANPTKLEKIREKKQAPLFIVFTTYRKHRRTDNTNHVRNKTEIPAGYPLVYYCFKHSTPSFISQLRERRQKILKKNTIKRRPSQKHTV